MPHQPAKIATIAPAGACCSPRSCCAAATDPNHIAELTSVPIALLTLLHDELHHPHTPRPASVDADPAPVLGQSLCTRPSETARRAGMKTPP